MSRKKPQFSADAQRCIESAKVEATREGALRLDSLHILVAAAKITPDAAKTALEASGIPSDDVSLSSPHEAPVSPAATGSHDEMKLVPDLKEVVYGPSLRGRAKGGIVNAHLLLAEILRRPSPRLQDHIRRLRGTGPLKSKHTRPAPEAAPYRSLRDYLEDRRQLWTLRCEAANALNEPLTGERPRYHAHPSISGMDGLLDTVARLEAKVLRRCEATREVSRTRIRLVGERDLSALAIELSDGAVVHEIYGLGRFFPERLTVRDLAQMASLDRYPRNCGQVVETVRELKASDVLSRDEDASGKLNERIRLSDGFLDELLDALKDDPLTGSDLKALSRTLRAADLFYEQAGSAL